MYADCTIYVNIAPRKILDSGMCKKCNNILEKVFNDREIRHTGEKRKNIDDFTLFYEEDINEAFKEIDEVIVLEDSRMGILAAHRAKIKSIMIPDILPADEETKKLYFKECKSLLDVIHLLKTFN